MVELVNAVASGDLGVELDLENLLEDLNCHYKHYHPEVHSGLQLRSEPDSPLLTVYRSGKYVIMGAKNLDSLSETYEAFLDEFKRLVVTFERDGSEPIIRNLIFRADLGREFDLSELFILLKLGNIEYEPEQSPFLYYWPEPLDCVISIAANGIVVVSGVRSRDEAEDAVEFLTDLINSATH